MKKATHKESPTDPKPTLRPYQVDVLVVPPKFMMDLGLASIHREKQTVYGTCLADAKRRAGIQ